MDHSNENKEETKKITVMMEQLDQTASLLSDIVSSLSSAIEEMNSNVHVVAENSNNLTEMSEEIDMSIVRGNRNVEDSIISINNIGEETSQLMDIFEKFIENVSMIQDVVSVINDIADQTNLLALNVAIEAARAGEHGRGFAIVADEVRKLAGKTSDSTKEIEKLAKDITMQSNNVQQKIETVNDVVPVEIGKISEVQCVFNMISNMIKELKNKIAEINLSIKEQSVAMNELAEQTDKVLQSANDIKSAIDISVNTINNLEKIVENLDRLVGVFKVKV
ncbi:MULTISPECIES: methyl-accepting chemotaxis protein [Calditerrivibrio]|uniref:methyl-accepting chemotaxis protein n=1 Tax=Calditerrivibrio TaxID=545865 RepID=UPI003C74582C